MSKYLSVERMQNLFLMVGLEPLPPIEVFKKWNQKQRQQVVRWAGAIMYRASDNDEVKIPPLPAICKPYFTQQGHPVK